MTRVANAPFRTVWVVDFEYVPSPGERVRPICMVARELATGQLIRLWEDQLRALRRPPFDTGHDSLFVAYNAIADLGCHLALDWPLPARVLDLYVEFRCQSNGLALPFGSGLLGACRYYSINTIAGVEKDANRDLILRGGIWSASERDRIMAYCLSDVEATTGLLKAMNAALDGPRSLLRGRQIRALANVEATGLPLDTGTLGRLQRHRHLLSEAAIREVNSELPVYDGVSFRVAALESVAERLGVSWPRLSSGRLKLDRETFQAVAFKHPALRPLVEVRSFLAQLRLLDFDVGADRRNRPQLWPFGTRTGRNRPKSSASLLLAANWLRALICPSNGCALAYIDWAQQEFAIAAALANDQRMLQAYESGDPYLAFAKQAGAVPNDATRHSHSDVSGNYATSLSAAC